MPESPVYTQLDGLPLYALSSTPDAGVPGYWAGYRAGPAGLGATATLSEVWQDAGGVYLFLASTPDDLAAFLAALDEILPKISPTGLVRGLWIDQPDRPPGYWRLPGVLLAKSSGSGGDIVWTVAREAQFDLGQYAVRIAAGAALGQADPGEAGYGVTVASDAVTFDAPRGSYPVVSGSAWLPLDGPEVGAWCARLELPAGEDGLGRLDVALRYALPWLADPDSGAVEPVSMPVLAQGEVPLLLALGFDPLFPLLAHRSALRFVLPGPTSPTLASAFVSAVGDPVTVAPLADDALGTARLAFGVTPYTVEDPGYAAYHLAPDGPFAVTVQRAAGGSPAARLALGLSGTEYAELDGGEAIALFRAGQPAYAPGARREAPVAGAAAASRSAASDEPLTALATTSWVTFLPRAPEAAAVTYYAQPLHAPLFAGGTALPPPFLSLHASPAGTFGEYPAGRAAAAAVPVVPVGAYARLPAELAEAARIVEAAALAPRRRAGIPPPEAGSAAAGDGPASAVTPQGLLANLDASGAWSGVVLAHLPDAPVPRVELTRVGPALRQTLQASELFLVVSDVDEFLSATSVAYRLDERSLALVAAAGVPAEVVEALRELLAGMTPPFPTFPDEEAFVTAIGPVVAEQYRPVALSIAGQFKADVQGWVFQLSPRSWRSAAEYPENPTVALFKYCGRSLAELVADPTAWNWPAAAADASGDVGPTQRLVLDVFEQAAAADSGPYRRFYDEVVANPAWTGTLVLNAPVSVSELPASLQFVAAGVDTRQFFAHHVGFSLTPVERAADGEPALGRTAAFGLIHYEDPTDLYLSSTVPFAFKTQLLSVRFAGAAVADFAAQVELMTNRLFGAELTKRDPEHGNNLVLQGALQRQQGTPSYAFTLQGTNVFDVAGSALESIEVLGLALQTSTGTDADGAVRAAFVLSGNLRFAELAHFDLFSYGPQGSAPAGQQPADGYLRFGNLAVHMTFPLATPAVQTFTSGEDRMSFDLASSLARELSLVRRFPVRVTGAVAVPAPREADAGGQRPEDLGYTPVLAPIEQAPLAPPWFGLLMTLQLGTVGALAGSAGLDLTVLAAWAPGTGGDALPVLVGLRLPGAGGRGATWSLQGVLKLAVGSVRFEVDEAGGPDGQRAYMLRMHRLALSVLGLSFPPGGTEVFVFGDPEAADQSALGWFAAYDSGAPPPAERRRRALQSGRRLPVTASREVR